MKEHFGDDPASTEVVKPWMRVEEVTGLVKKWHYIIGESNYEPMALAA